MSRKTNFVTENFHVLPCVRSLPFPIVLASETKLLLSFFKPTRNQLLVVLWLFSDGNPKAPCQARWVWIQRKSPGHQLQFIRTLREANFGLILTRREHMGGISCKNDSTNSEFVTPSRRKCKWPRPENVDTLPRKLDVDVTHPDYDQMPASDCWNERIMLSHTLNWGEWDTAWESPQFWHCWTSASGSRLASQQIRSSTVSPHLFQTSHKLLLARHYIWIWNYLGSRDRRLVQAYNPAPTVESLDEFLLSEEWSSGSLQPMFHCIRSCWVISPRSLKASCLTYADICSITTPFGSRYDFLVNPVLPSEPTRNFERTLVCAPETSEYWQYTQSLSSSMCVTVQEDRSCEQLCRDAASRRGFSRAGCRSDMTPTCPIPPSVFARTSRLAHANIAHGVGLTVSVLNFKNGLSCKLVLLAMKCTIPIAGVFFIRKLTSEQLLRRKITHQNPFQCRFYRRAQPLAAI